MLGEHLNVGVLEYPFGEGAGNGFTGCVRSVQNTPVVVTTLLGEMIFTTRRVATEGNALCNKPANSVGALGDNETHHVLVA